MKVVFPCKGALVLLKQDLESLNAFYNTQILTSKLSETYQNSNTIMQVKNFNYLPHKSSIVLYKADILTIGKMKQILGIQEKTSTNSSLSNTDNTNYDEENSKPISDDDILSNPFFQTLQPLN